MLLPVSSVSTVCGREKVFAAFIILLPPRRTVVDGGSGFRVMVRKLSAPHVYRSRALLALNGQQRSTRSQSLFLEPFSLSFYIFRLRATVGFLDKVCAAAYHYEKEDARARSAGARGVSAMIGWGLLVVRA